MKQQIFVWKDTKSCKVGKIDKFFPIARARARAGVLNK